MRSHLQLDVSVVVYQPDFELLWRTLDSLAQAVQLVQRDQPLSVALWLIDNDDLVCDDAVRAIDSTDLARLRRGLARLRHFDSIELLHGHGNIGYGAGHNLAIERASGELHLVLNADVELAIDALRSALQFLSNQPQAGLLAPAVTDATGQPQFLCKRYPSVLDLLLRGFAPAPLKRCFQGRLGRYELHDQIATATAEPVWDVPIVSGCFMLIRRAALRQAGGFCPRYFLYFEDFELSLELARVTRSVYLPSVHIVHHGGEAARKGWRHVVYFVRSAMLFFRRNGWKWV